MDGETEAVELVPEESETLEFGVFLLKTPRQSLRVVNNSQGASGSRGVGACLSVCTQGCTGSAGCSKWSWQARLGKHADRILKA